MSEQVTPMMAQYLEIKSQYEDCIVFYRLGDFYEMFNEDAVTASQELEITLTARNKNAENPTLMCGVPHHSAQEYIKTLVEKGYKVAICEQMEDAKVTKGMVKREVVQVITPGTLLDATGRDEKVNSFLAAIIYQNGYQLAYVDITTGMLKVTTLQTQEELIIELNTLNIAELVVDNSVPESTIKQLKKIMSCVFSTFELPSPMDDTTLFNHLVSAEQKNISEYLIGYVASTQMRSLVHLQRVESYETSQFLKMDTNAKINLEIMQSQRFNAKKWSLLWLLDETKTAMGGRMLRLWLEKPLIQRKQIEMRYDKIDNLMRYFFERLDLVATLKSIYDLERLVAKVSFASVNARELIQLKSSLQQIPIIKTHLKQMNEDGIWDDLLDQLPELNDVVDLIDRAIVDEPPISTKEGGVIKDGYHELLDTYRDAMTNGKQWIVNLQHQEREKTGIKTLKVGFNRVFGYYIEVTKGQLHLLEEGRYERKQTLTNAERFITPELKEKERLILEAEDKSLSLEYELFVSVREFVQSHSQTLQQLAKSVATIDVLQSFTQVSEDNHYVRPTLAKEQDIHIVQGRHPVVEKVVGIDKYVPNDVICNQQERLLLITGPNMSGKSTYMRQVALMSIMAQIGCFVPAKQATLPIFDRIFTRIGAADDLVSGQSTFMVEMMETNVALQQATKNSLLLFDEIGRGTATYDGMALAEAILRYVHQNVQSLAIFSTHYHELTVLDNELESLVNIHVGAVEQNGQLIFLHKIQRGPADKSYGLHVAQLAGLPKSLISEAAIILKRLESGENLSGIDNSDASVNQKPAYIDEVMTSLKAVDLNQTSPIDALLLLQHLQTKINNERET